jgi:hypothetical protein
MINVLICLYKSFQHNLIFYYVIQKIQNAFKKNKKSHYFINIYLTLAILIVFMFVLFQLIKRNIDNSFYLK